MTCPGFIQGTDFSHCGNVADIAYMQKKIGVAFF